MLHSQVAFSTQLLATSVIMAQPGNVPYSDPIEGTAYRTTCFIEDDGHENAAADLRAAIGDHCTAFKAGYRNAVLISGDFFSIYMKPAEDKLEKALKLLKKLREGKATLNEVSGMTEVISNIVSHVDEIVKELNRCQSEQGQHSPAHSVASAYSRYQLSKEEELAVRARLAKRFPDVPIELIDHFMKRIHIQLVASTPNTSTLYYGRASQCIEGVCTTRNFKKAMRIVVRDLDGIDRERARNMFFDKLLEYLSEELESDNPRAMSAVRFRQYIPWAEEINAEIHAQRLRGFLTNKS